MWFVWIVLMIAAAGYFIYRIDKKIKIKFEDKFNPHQWDLPRSFELGVEQTPQPIATPAATEKLRYSRKASVLNDIQRPIFNALQQALAGDYFLLTNINAADVLNINPNGNLLAFQIASKNLMSKQFDFLVCDKHQVRALCAITLGDHLDPLLESACENVQLPLARFKVQTVYDVTVIRASLLKALGVGSGEMASTSESALEISDARESQAEPESVRMAESEMRMVESGIALEQCPECSAVMLKRKAKTGASAGKLFWICSSYPKCRGILPVK
jgi:hypothetical protein